MPRKKNKKLFILRDTRESDKTIYTYSATKWTDKVLVINKALVCGDFSVVGGEGDIFIERKTISDLCGSFTHDRDRFSREWERAFNTDIRYKYLMIEGKLQDIIDGNYRSGVFPQSLLGSIMSWSLRYGYHWFCVDNARQGENCVYYLLSNFLRLTAERINDRL